MRNKLNRSGTWSAEQTIFNKAFTVAGIGFLAITILGLICYYIMDSTEVGRLISETNASEIYGSIRAGAGMSLIAKLSLTSWVLIVITSILQFVWWFRIQTAGKLFIYSTWIGYIVGQGIAFGFLFLTFSASELFLIFGLAGGLFATMAIVGYYSKDLSGMIRYLFAGSIFTIVFGLVLTILSATGTLNLSNSFGVSTWLWDILFFLSGFILLGYIMWTVWRLRKVSDWAQINGMEPEMRFRYIAFFGFRLMSDLVALIWTIARFVARARR